MKISIFTPSFNKYEYVETAINSVLDQSYTDFEYWIIENSDDQRTRALVRRLAATDNRIKFCEIDYDVQQRRDNYVTALILNEYYQKANGDYIFYLSDDDILYSTCFAQCIALFESNPEVSVVCFPLKVSQEVAPQEFQPLSRILPVGNMGLQTDYQQVDCVLDGGQIAHKKACLDLLDKPYFSTSLDDAGHVDGLFLQKLAAHYTFYTTGQEDLGEHRRTLLSNFVRAI